MQNSRTVEIWVGLFVALGMAALFGLALRVSHLNEFRNGDGYRLTAYFDNIGGLKKGSPVTMAGVKVGQVESIRFDQQYYKARVELIIRSDVDRLPKDTNARIMTSGLLGEQYIGLEPGAEDDYLTDGDLIAHTQSALVLEQIIGQFLYSTAAGDK